MKQDFISEMRSQITHLTNKYFPLEKFVSIRPEINVLPYLEFVGTYILGDEKQIIYVGNSVRVGRRILEHLRNQSERSFADEISSIQIARFQLWEQAEALESILINRIHPKHNRSIPPHCSYLYRLNPKEQKRILSVVYSLAESVSPVDKARNANFV